MLPTFIIVGAAKAGTTALYWYLAEHPAVFMSRVKEANYFAYGLDGEGRLLYGDPDVHRFPVKSLAAYEGLFAGAAGATAIGEASPIYLECPQAAGRIRELLPAARIICSLRQPVERAYSDYLMYLRRRGRRFDSARDLTTSAEWARPDSRWMQVSRYHDQLARYYETFPRERIHVLLIDDFKPSPVRAVQEVYRFLELDPSFIPDFDTPHAPGGIPASTLLEGFLTSGPIVSAVKPWVPVQAANWIRRLRTRNMRKPPALPPELKRELTAPLRQDILRTSQLIGRSLEHWL
ncbi:MAG: sulfotransferase [Gemmatimonadales bacterium]|nr:sulfotransferase [Gemmatimonadales bacterium]